MSSRVRIVTEKILTQRTNDKASKTELPYGKNKCYYCSKLGHVIPRCPNFRRKLQTKT